MSYDVNIAGKSFNQTFNGCQFFYDHIPAVEGSENSERGGLYRLDGLTGREALEVLSNAFERIEKTRQALGSDGEVGEPKLCAKYDAPNGWGSTVGMLTFLGRLMAACAANPDDLVGVC